MKRTIFYPKKKSNLKYQKFKINRKFNKKINFSVLNFYSFSFKKILFIIVDLLKNAQDFENCFLCF